MKKNIIAKVCFASSSCLLLGFIIKTIVDYSRYSSTLNSAPFYIWVLANAVYFIIPAMIVLFAGLFIKRRSKKN